MDITNRKTVKREIKLYSVRDIVKNQLSSDNDTQTRELCIPQISSDSLAIDNIEKSKLNYTRRVAYKNKEKIEKNESISSSYKVDKVASDLKTQLVDKKSCDKDATSKHNDSDSLSKSKVNDQKKGGLLRIKAMSDDNTETEKVSEIAVNNSTKTKTQTQLNTKTSAINVTLSAQQIDNKAIPEKKGGILKIQIKSTESSATTNSLISSQFNLPEENIDCDTLAMKKVAIIEKQFREIVERYHNNLSSLQDFCILGSRIGGIELHQLKSKIASIYLNLIDSNWIFAVKHRIYQKLWMLYSEIFDLFRHALGSEEFLSIQEVKARLHQVFDLFSFYCFETVVQLLL